MEDAGQKLKRARERLNLRYRDVEEASLHIAERHQNEEFIIALSRLSDIENKGTVPTIYRLYSLCAIYRLNLSDVLSWYGADPAGIPADSAATPLAETHVIGFSLDGATEVVMPVALDPGLDFRKTTYLSRMIQRWGKIPLTLLNSLDIQNHRYAFIGADDWNMYPLIPPTSMVIIDESRRKVVNTGWTTEFERPIYFLETRDGFVCGWCDLAGERLILVPHPASGCHPSVYTHPAQIEVVGQVTGVAMLLGSAPNRRAATEMAPSPRY
jgi:transcriptional regulator with XRE-family HTH domain